MLSSFLNSGVTKACFKLFGNSWFSTEQLYNLCKGDFKISTNSFKIFVGISSAPGAFFGFKLFISVSICFSVTLLNENFSARSTCILILIILGWL